MRDVSDDLIRAVDEAVPRLRALTESESLLCFRPGGWSRREILGHLIDSAVNNHQRFVRAQLDDPLIFPAYQQEAWVAAQGYRDAPWPDLVSLWSLLNAHLSRVIALIPEPRLSTSCSIGDGPPVTLEFIARDYVRHLRHHLAQILDPESAQGKQYPPFAAPDLPRGCLGYNRP